MVCQDMVFGRFDTYVISDVCGITVMATQRSLCIRKDRH
jgi:hypothetical protein